MTETQFNLQKIEAVLVPFRINSVDNRVPTALAEALMLLGQTVESSVDAAAVDSVATDNDNLYFYKFFADVLFLTDADGFKRMGIENAFAGLEEVLRSVDITI